MTCGGVADKANTHSHRWLTQTPRQICIELGVILLNCTLYTLCFPPWRRNVAAVDSKSHRLQWICKMTHRQKKSQISFNKSLPQRNPHLHCPRIFSHWYYSSSAEKSRCCLLFLCLGHCYISISLSSCSLMCVSLFHGDHLLAVILDHKTYLLSAMYVCPWRTDRDVKECFHVFSFYLK